MTLAARPAIVTPTAVTAWKAAAVKHPLLMTPAELLGLRESLRLSRKSLAATIGRSERNVYRWEAESGEQRISRDTADALLGLVAYTDAAVAALVEASPEVITIYRTDEAFRANVDTGGRVLSAAWHREVAGRAAEQIPDARIDDRA